MICRDPEFGPPKTLFGFVPFFFLTKHFIFISGFFISLFLFLFIADTGRYEPVGRMPAAIVGRLICIQCPCASHGPVSSED